MAVRKHGERGHGTPQRRAGRGTPPDLGGLLWASAVWLTVMMAPFLVLFPLR